MGWEEIFLSRLNVGWKLKNFDTCSRHCPDLKLGPNIMFDGSKFSSGCGLQLCINGRTLSDPSKWSKKAGEGIFPPNSGALKYGSNMFQTLSRPQTWINF